MRRVRPRGTPRAARTCFTYGQRARCGVAPIAPATPSSCDCPRRATRGNAELPGCPCGWSRQSSGPNCSISVRKRSASTVRDRRMKGCESCIFLAMVDQARPPAKFEPEIQAPDSNTWIIESNEDTTGSRDEIGVGDAFERTLGDSPGINAGSNPPAPAFIRAECHSQDRMASPTSACWRARPLSPAGAQLETRTDSKPRMQFTAHCLKSASNQN